jgi:CRP-like cAMP-binding protein
MIPNSTTMGGAMRRIPPRFAKQFPPGSWFDTLPAKLLQRLTDYGRTLVFDPGEAIVHEGLHEEWLNVNLEGRVDLECADPVSGQPITLLKLGPGDIVGERGILDNDPPIATARAISEVTTYRLHHPAIAWMLMVVPEAIPRFIEKLQLDIDEFETRKKLFGHPESREQLRQLSEESARAWASVNGAADLQA